MGWLRNIFSALARSFAWFADATTYIYNVGLRVVQGLWGRFGLALFPIIGIILTTHKLASYIVRPIRQFFINGAHSGFVGGVFDFSGLVCNWVGVVNSCFPLDELFQLMVHSALILFGLWASLSLVRLVKTAIGGWF